MQQNTVAALAGSSAASSSYAAGTSSLSAIPMTGKYYYWTPTAVADATQKSGLVASSRKRVSEVVRHEVPSLR